MPNLADIEAEARLIVDADSVSYSAAALLRRENAAYEEVVGDILGYDGLWQFDDSRFTTFPIATTTLINSQNDYTFDSSVLDIEAVSVLDANGLWRKLSQIDISQMGQDPAEFYKTDGLPFHYDKQGNSLLLYPAPDNGASVTLASGLKVFFSRTASIFTSAEQTAGTAIPGFYSPAHYIISYKSALPFAMAYKPERVAMIRVRIVEYQKMLKEFYGHREKDRRKIMSMGGVKFR